MGLIEQIAEMRAEEARDSVQKAFVTYLLANTNNSAEEIASITKASVSFVEKVKQSLDLNNTDIEKI